MNALMNKAIAAVSRLPDAEQEAIARELLERIEAESRWATLLADPRSKATLRRLAAEARSEMARGEVSDGDPSDGK